MSRNEDVRKILESREIAERERKQIKTAQVKRRRDQYLELGFVRNALWPSNRR